MAFTVIIGGTDVTRAVTAPPTINDEINANCCTFQFTVQQERNPQNLLGKVVEMYINGVRWFYGTVRTQEGTANGDIALTVYDPLFTFSRFTDDFYFKTQTATQIFTTCAEKTGVPLGAVANTEDVFPQLYYPAAAVDKVCVDVLARTRKANGRKFWYRFDPVTASVTMFERTVPADIWVFKVGLNLTAASKSDSVTETFTSVKLVNRETGQTVVKTNDAVANEYDLHTQYFEEMSSDDTTDINTQAATRLEEKSKLASTMRIEGINPDGVIPRLYKGDPIYVEEPNTGLVGGYYIRNITTTVQADTLIVLAMDIVAAPDLPEIQYDDATKLTTDSGKTTESTKESEITVYLQPDGKIYHKAGCPVIEGCNCTATTKDKAKEKGALQCAVCKA